MSIANCRNKPVGVVLVGCGAVAELYYAPALRELEWRTEVAVLALFDPDPARSAALHVHFPKAQIVDDFTALARLGVELAVVASPARFHASQTTELVRRGLSVLCEKPMATTVAEAEMMIREANTAGRMLAIGLFRRFFPAAQVIREMLDLAILGPVRSFSFSEGGVFEWPAQSASFFKKESTPGGVLLDLGVHLLDLAIWWFGQPSEAFYEDDSMGGLEANCRIRLQFGQGFTGEVRLSRDWALSNRYVIECEKGWLSWRVGEADKVQIGLHSSSFALNAQLHNQISSHALPAVGTQSAGYHLSFVEQLRNAVAAARGEQEVLVSGEQGIQSLRLVERCYSRRSLLPMPWLSEQEHARAGQLAIGRS